MRDRRQDNDKWILLIVACFLSLIIISVLMVFVLIPMIRDKGEVVLQGNEAISSQTDMRDVLVKEESLGENEDIQDDYEENKIEKLTEGNFQITMSTEWNYPDVDTPAEDSYVENAQNNAYDAEFEIVLKEDESALLYSSPRLPIGSFTKRIPIKRHLEPGKYDCVVKYTLFYPGTDEKAGTIRVGLTINIGI